jgi:peptide/nickel transport system substrate-binding protein
MLTASVLPRNTQGMQRFLIGVILSIGLAGAAAAGPADNSLVWASDSMPANVLPYGNNLREGVVFTFFVWDSPTYRDPISGDYKLHLADSVRLIDDTTIELHMRAGVVAHDGQVVDARDVVDTVGNMLDPAAHIVAYNRVNWLAGAELVDEHTVRLKMKTPFGPWQEYLTSLPILPREAYARLGPDGMARTPVGTGPYRISAISAGQQVVMQRNENYFGGAKGQPNIARIVFRHIPDQETQIAELMSGGLDFIWRLSSDQAEQLRSVDGLKVTAGGTIRIGTIDMDAAGRSGTDNPMTVLKVRQAINHAIDRESLAKNLAGEGAAVIDTPCHPKQFGCLADQAVHYDFDPQLAKKLLAEAGYPDGFELTINAYRERPWVEAIIGDLRRVGIRARLNWLQADTSVTELRAGHMRLSYGAWGSTSIFDIAASTGYFFNLGPDDAARDEVVASLLKRGDQETDPAKRLAAYGPAIHRITEQAYWVPVLAYPQIVAFNSHLQFSPSEDEVPRFFQAKWTK